MLGHSFNAMLLAATHQPYLQSLIIIIGTFILEDAATVLAALRAEEGMIPVRFALVALYIGIILGDMGLYGLGRLSARTGWFQRWMPTTRTRSAHDWIKGRIIWTVLVSRFIPGMRLPTYLTCGYVGIPFTRFVVAVIGATLLWTSLLFALSMTFGHFMLNYLGEWRWAGAIGFAVAVILIIRAAGRHYEGHYE